MRKLKISGLLILLAATVTSCDLLFDLFHTQSDLEESVVYNLALSFQDASGKDLVNGIELKDYATVNLNAYNLDIIASEPRESRYDAIVGIKKYNDSCCYLTKNLNVSIREDRPEERKLTYRLQCPHVFGDNDVHYIVTYWDIPKDKKGLEYYAKCTLIEYGGNKIMPHIDEDERFYIATIILNN
ncbi:MAG: hypothetical protein H6Q15_2325 [Bacteroidetes bacterium]|nr:hypothetical protein [Bacteroidota bacterium]